MNQCGSLKATAALVARAVLGLSLLSWSVQALASVETTAASGFYAVAGWQFSKIEDIGQTDVGEEDNGYSAGIGYRINSQWAVELTKVQLMDKTYQTTPVRAPAFIESQGVGLTVLGIAQLEPDLSFYYRAGLQTLKHDVALPYIESVSEEGSTTVTQISYQQIDATKTHLMLGLGVEQQWTANWSGRIEAEHTFKRDDVAFNTIRLSAVYRF